MAVEVESDFEDVEEYSDEDVDPGYQDLEDDLDDEDEVAAAPEEDEQEAPEQQEPTKPPVDQKEYNRLAYDYRILQREQRELVRRFDHLIGVLSQPQQQYQPEPQLPDPDEDLGGFLAGKLELMEQRQEYERMEKQQREAQEAIEREIQYAQSLASQYGRSNPEVYGNAVEFLTQQLWEEMREEYPTAMDEEIGGELYRQAQARLVTWVRAGKNPGEELMKMAKRRGFNFNAVAANGNGRPQPSVAKNGAAKQTIQARKEKQAKGRTISSLQGSSPGQRLTAKKILQLSDDEFADEVRSLSKQRGRKLPLRELLKGKEKPDSVNAM